MKNENNAIPTVKLTLAHCKLMIDSGAQINLVKQNVIPEDLIESVDNEKIITLRGITAHPIKTLKEIKVRINNILVAFQVVPQDFNIKQDGILGCEFLYQTGAKIDYLNKYLVIENIKIPFVYENITENKINDEINDANESKYENKINDDLNDPNINNINKNITNTNNKNINNLQIPKSHADVGNTWSELDTKFLCDRQAEEVSLKGNSNDYQNITMHSQRFNANQEDIKAENDSRTIPSDKELQNESIDAQSKVNELKYTENTNLQSLKSYADNTEYCNNKKNENLQGLKSNDGYKEYCINTDNAITQCDIHIIEAENKYFSDLKNSITQNDTYNIMENQIFNSIDANEIKITEHPTDEINEIFHKNLPYNTFYEETRFADEVTIYNEKVEQDTDIQNLTYEEVLNILHNKNETEVSDINIIDIIDRNPYPLINKEHQETKSLRQISTINDIEKDLSTGTREEQILSLVDVSHLQNEIEKNHVINLIKKNIDRFTLEHEDLEAANVSSFIIETTTDVPVVAYQYRTPYNLREEVNSQIENLLKKGLIRPSKSDYRSPIWIVKKKKLPTDTKQRYRIVWDYRKLNRVTVPQIYPMKSATEIFDQLGGSKWFTTLDLRNGFMQILLDEKSAKKTAFGTENGFFEFVRLPFGVRNGPAKFQETLDKALRGLTNVFAFIDDIIIHAESLEQHKKIFNKVLQRLREFKLSISIEKCKFLKKEVEYLGHIISVDGIKTNPKIISAVRDFPRPRNVKNVRQLLGLFNYYHRFVDGFAKLSNPITKLLEKNVKFEWTEEADKALKILKEMLCSSPILQFPDFSKDFIVKCDSSGYSIGGLLCQMKDNCELPIAYTSRVLNKAEKNYAVIEKEALAIYHCIKIFKHYLYGRKFFVFSDHKPLCSKYKSENNMRVLNWRNKLSDMDYEVIYRPGKSNLEADFFSRNPPVTEVNVTTRAQQRKNLEKNQEFELQKLKKNKKRAHIKVNNNLEEAKVSLQNKNAD